MRQSRIVRICNRLQPAIMRRCSACRRAWRRWRRWQAVERPPPPAQVVRRHATPPPTSQGPTWTQNVFEPASTFKDQCQSPRSGTDIEGNTFPDQAGSLIEEQLWLRSWTEETYLWNDEVVDQDPNRVCDGAGLF